MYGPNGHHKTSYSSIQKHLYVSDCSFLRKLRVRVYIKGVQDGEEGEAGVGPEAHKKYLTESG